MKSTLVALKPNTGPARHRQRDNPLPSIIALGKPVQALSGFADELEGLLDRSVTLPDDEASYPVLLATLPSKDKLDEAIAELEAALTCSATTDQLQSLLVLMFDGLRSKAGADAVNQVTAHVGKLKFNDTPQGEMAMGMVSRGEIGSLSAGYAVHQWEVSDAEGNVIDGADVDSVRWDDSDLTFTATSWELLEASLVSVPADSGANIRSLGGGGDRHADVRARMLARERMSARQRMYDRQARVFGGGLDD